MASSTPPTPTQDAPAEPPRPLYKFYKPPIFVISPTFRSYVRLTAHDIHHSLHRSYPYHVPPDIYFFTNHPLRCVTVTGIVIARDDWERRTALVIDDSSGELLDVIVPAAHLPDVAHIRELCIVEAKGTIDEFRERRQMILRGIRRVDCMEEVETWEELVAFKRSVLLRPWEVPEEEEERIMREHRRERRREQRRREKEMEELARERTARGWGEAELVLDRSSPLRRRKVQEEPLRLDSSPPRKRRPVQNQRQPRVVTPPPPVQEEVVLDRSSPLRRMRIQEEPLRLDSSPPRKRRPVLDQRRPRVVTPPPPVQEEVVLDRSSPLRRRRVEEEPLKLDSSPPRKRRPVQNQGRLRVITPPPPVKEEVVLDKTPPRHGSGAVRGTAASPVVVKEELVLDRSPPRIGMPPRRSGPGSRHSTPLPVVKEEWSPKNTPLKSRQVEQRAPPPIMIKEEAEELVLDKTPPRSPRRSAPTGPRVSRKRPASPGVQLKEEARTAKRIREKPPEDIHAQLGYEIDPVDLSIILDPSPPHQRPQRTPSPRQEDCMILDPSPPRLHQRPQRTPSPKQEDSVLDPSPPRLHQRPQRTPSPKQEDSVLDPSPPRSHQRTQRTPPPKPKDRMVLDPSPPRPHQRTQRTPPPKQKKGCIILDSSPPRLHQRPQRSPSPKQEDSMILDPSPPRSHQRTQRTPPPKQKKGCIILDSSPPRPHQRTQRTPPPKPKDRMILDPSPPRSHQRPQRTPSPKQEDSVILDPSPPRSHQRTQRTPPPKAQKKGCIILDSSPPRPHQRTQRTPPPKQQEDRIILDSSPPRIRSQTQRIQQTQPSRPTNPSLSLRPAPRDRSQHSMTQLTSRAPPPARPTARRTTPPPPPDPLPLDRSPPRITRTQPATSRALPTSGPLPTSTAIPTAPPPASTAPLPHKKPSLRTLKALIISHLYSQHYTFTSLPALLSTVAITAHAARVPGAAVPQLVQTALAELTADGYLLPESGNRWIVVGAQSLREILEEAAAEGVLEVGRVWRRAKARGGVWAGVGKEVVREAVVEWVRGRKGWRERGRGEWVKG